MDYIIGTGFFFFGLAWLCGFVGWLAAEGKWFNRWTKICLIGAALGLIIAPATISYLEIRL